MTKRSCTLCGHEYEASHPEKICTKSPLGFGNVCGGEIQPPPAPSFRPGAADEIKTENYHVEPKPDCLVCLDTGKVEMSDGSVIKCHRGCGRANTPEEA